MISCGRFVSANKKDKSITSTSRVEKEEQQSRRWERRDGSSKCEWSLLRRCAFKFIILPQSYSLFPLTLSHLSLLLAVNACLYCLFKMKSVCFFIIVVAHFTHCYTNTDTQRVSVCLRIFRRFRTVVATGKGVYEKLSV